jgi:hypothetical protein
MRTDCKLYSKEFIETTKEYIMKTWDEKYLNREIEEASTHATECDKEEAPHEAIRPTNIELKELPIIVTDYSDVACKGDTIPKRWIQNFNERCYKGDTIYFDRVRLL